MYFKYFNDFQNQIFSFITKVNPNNRNETKSDIYPETYSSLTSFFTGRKILSMLFITSIFLFHCKSEQKQVK